MLAVQINGISRQIHSRSSLAIGGDARQTHGQALQVEGKINADTLARILEDKIELTSRGNRRTGLDEGKVGIELRGPKGIVRQGTACLVGAAVRELGYRVPTDRGERGRTA